MRLALLFCLFLAAAPAGAALLDAEAVERALAAHFAENGPWRAEQIEVRVRPFPPRALPEGRVELRVIAPRERVAPGTRAYLVEASAGGKEAQRLWVQAEVRLYDVVLVSARPIGRGQRIVAEDLRRERREVGGLSQRPLIEPAEALGKQAARAIAANEILTPALVELPVAVKRGVAVKMLYETPRLAVEARGRALEDGRVGEIIRVKNPSSGKVVEAKVVDAHTVRVNW